MITHYARFIALSSFTGSERRGGERAQRAVAPLRESQLKCSKLGSVEDVLSLTTEIVCVSQVPPFLYSPFGQTFRVRPLFSCLKRVDRGVAFNSGLATAIFDFALLEKSLGERDPRSSLAQPPFSQARSS